MSPCFGFSVRRGTLVVGLIETVSESLAALFYILGLIALSDYKDETEIRVIEGNFRIPFVNMEEGRNIELVVNSLNTIFGVGLFTSIINIGFSLLLIRGVCKSNLIYLKAWRVFKIGGLCMAIAYMLLMLYSGYSTVYQITSDISRVLLHSYFLWVGHTYIGQLTGETTLALSSSFIEGTKERIEASFPL